MKKVMIFILLLFLPVFVNASTISINFECPQVVNKGEVLSCNVTLNQSGGVKEISGSFNYNGLTFNSFAKNGSYSSSSVNSSGFKFTNDSGFSSKTLLGTLKLNVPSNALDNSSYNVSIKNLKGKDLNGNEIVGANQIKNVRIASQNSNLSKLSVTGSTISFDPNTLVYDIETEIETVSITATAADVRAKVSGIGMKHLNYGLNKYDIVVTAESGNTKTYVLNITRKDTRSNDATLSSLKVTGSTFTFEPETLIYNIEVNSSEVSIIATATNKKAKITGAGIKTLGYGLNKYDIVVTAENGETKTYVLNITRNGEKSNKVYLSKLEIEGLPFTFTPETLTYNLETSLDKINIIATAADSNAVVTGTGSKKLSSYGTNVFKIVVTIDNKYTNVYTLNINRIDDRPGAVYLSKLEVDGIPFNFAPNILNYNLRTNLNEINITATASTDGATITGSGLKELSSGQNLFEIKVSKGDSSRTYKLYILKSGNGVSGETTPEPSDESEEGPQLSDLYVAGSTIEFDPDKHEYSVDTYLETANVVAKSDDNDVTVNCENGSKLNIGNNTCEVEVKDKDGVTAKYKININRKVNNNNNKDNSGKVETNNAEVKNIVIKDHEFSFNKDIYSYDLKTDYKRLDITVIPKEMSTAVIIKGNHDLIDGSKITITSIALDGAFNTYVINIVNEKVEEEIVQPKVKTLDLMQIIVLGIELLIILILLIKLLFGRNK